MGSKRANMTVACCMKLTGDSDAEVWARAEHTQHQGTSEESKNLFWEEIFKEIFQMSFKTACLRSAFEVSFSSY